MTAVQNITKSTPLTRAQRGDLADKFLGVTLAAGGAALFWMLVLAGLGRAFGFEVSASALGLTGSSIFAFLAYVTSALIARA